MLLSYVLAEALLILLSIIIIATALRIKGGDNVGVGIYLLYIIWGIGQFFGEKKIFNYIKSGITFVFGVASYLVILISIAYLLKIFFPE